MPTVSLTSSQNPSTFGQTVTLAATVGPQFAGATVPTGTVLFTVGGRDHYSLNLVNGVATWTSAALTPPSVYVAISYSGDGNYQGGNASLTQTVNKGTPAITLTSSQNPTTIGQTITFTVTVGPQFTGAAVPTGSVNFVLAGQTSPATLTNGSAQVKAFAATLGAHSVQAQYSGDANYQSGNSQQINQVVNQASTTTALAASPNPSTPGQAVTLTATVSPVSLPITGSVQFSDGGTNLSTPVALSVSGVASYQISALAVGTHSLKATYSGDADYQGSTSNTVSQVVSYTEPPPSILPGGVVPIYSTVSTIQSGEWVSIYGTNLADSTVLYNASLPYPTSLGGTRVTIDGNPAYLYYVSPTQIDVVVPGDTATGSVPVVAITAAGNANATVTMDQFGPSFLLLDSKHVAGIILRTNGSGSQGGGTYDILGPTGDSLGYPTVAAKAGDVIELFANGLGPTNPAVPAGHESSGAAPTTNSVQLLINNVSVTPAFAGLTTEVGLYQINLTVPAGLGTGDVPLVASVGGVQTPAAIVISLQ